MFGMSMWEILVVLGLLFIVVGPHKLPGLAKKLGEQIRGLKRSLQDVKATVDADDEFVKAVSEARQSVAEAKDAVRGLLDDVVNVAEEPVAPDAGRDPAPKAVPKGRRRVSRGKPAPVAPDAPASPGPALADGPVEAEDWRASARTVTDAAGDPESEAGDEVDDRDEAEPAPRPRAHPSDTRGVPRRTAPRRGSTGRRMVRPGRNKDQ